MPDGGGGVVRILLPTASAPAPAPAIASASASGASVLRAFAPAHAKLAARAPDLAEDEVCDGDVGAVGVEREAW